MYSSTSADYANDSANRALDRVGMLELRVSSLAALLISRTERGVQAAEQAVDRIEAGNV
jgi:hypothetical protein